MSAPGDIATGPGWELRCGDYREVLADVTCDAVITDPPYSERTHAGHDSLRGKHGHRRLLSYSVWGAADVAALFGWAVPCGWIVAFSDHVLAPEYESAATTRGRCAFAPLPWFARGSRVRLAGDGPSSWTTWINVSRPRSEPWSRWGTLPGGYDTPAGNHATFASGAQAARHIGGKPLWLMRALVRDYSRPGDLICDPCAGGGTTLLAAVIEGRRAIGAELDPKTFDLAVKRLKRGYTPAMEWEAAE